MTERERRMILQIASHARQIDAALDAERVKFLPRSNTRTQQHRGRLQRARAQNREREQAGRQRQRQRTLRRADVEFVGEQRQQRLHAVQQRKGRKARKKQRKTDA